MAKKEKVETRESKAMRVSIDDFVEEYQERLKFDKNALDEALEEQAGCYMDISQRLALETSLRDQAKAELAETEAEIDLDIRNEAANKGIKTTEKEVEAKKTTHEYVVKARKRVNSLTENVRRLEGLKESFQQRSYMLKELASLYIAGYYGDAVVKGGTGMANTAKASSARQEMNKERQRVKSPKKRSQ